MLYPDTNIPFYVGKGTGRRCYRHLTETIEKTSNPFKVRVIERIRKNGLEPIIEIVQDKLTEDDAMNLEIELIATHKRRIDGGTLTNLAEGGIGTSGYKFTEEQRENISKSHIGLKHSEEAKQKVSEKNSGLKRSPEMIEKYRQSKTGSNNPAFGKPSPNRGKKMSEEAKAKIRAARAKQIITDETKTKMSEALKRRHANGDLSSADIRAKVSEGLKQAHIRKPGSWRYGQQL